MGGTNCQSARGRKFPQLGNNFRDIAVLEDADARNAGSSRSHALFGIRRINASQRQHRHSRLRSASMATCDLEFADPGSLRAGLPEDWAEDPEIRPVRFGGFHFLNRVARDTDYGCHHAGLHEDRARLRGYDVVRAQMHSVCSARYCNVNPRIDEQTRATLGGIAGIHFSDNRCRSLSQFNQFASTQVFFPKLNRIHSGCTRCSNAIKQQTHAFIMIGREVPAIRDVVEKQAPNLPCSPSEKVA